MEKIYYMSKMEFQISIKVEGDAPLIIKDTISQLVYASDKDKAREAVIGALKKEYPDAMVYSCRIDDTIIGA